LISTDGDTAVLLQGTSSGRGPFNFSFDVRGVWSHDDRPLIPSPAFIDGLGGGLPTGSQVGGSYTQASGTVGYRLGSAYLSVIGSLRKDANHRSDYSYGPSVNWQLLSRNGFQVSFQADAQRTRTTTAAFAGFRLIYSGRHLSVLGDAGVGGTDGRNGSAPSRTRALGGLSANYLYEDSNRTQLSAGGGIERHTDSTIAHAGGTLYSRFGNVRTDFLDNLEGPGGVQYGLSVQSAVAVAGGEIGLGSRDLDDSAVIVEVDGKGGDASFEVLINDTPYGHIRSGGQLAVHLQPYRAYEVRLRPRDGAPAGFDDGAKQVTLYPGSVRVVRWTAHSYFTAFGQAIDSGGRPFANAMVQAPHSVGETDGNGYFQIDVADGDQVKLTRGGESCEIRVNSVKSTKDFVSLGKVSCQ
jgi:hypothetical protein